MSKHIRDHLDRGDARIVAAPVRAPAPAAKIRSQVESDRNFGLPTTLYGVTVGCYLAFLGVLFAAFGGPGLIIPMTIFVAVIAAGFGVPAIWTRLKGNTSEPMTMGNFKQTGIMTHTGPLTSKDAAIQVLTLPVLAVVWALAIVTIAALV